MQSGKQFMILFLSSNLNKDPIQVATKIELTQHLSYFCYLLLKVVEITVLFLNYQKVKNTAERFLLQESFRSLKIHGL